MIRITDTLAVFCIRPCSENSQFELTDTNNHRI